MRFKNIGKCNVRINVDGKRFLLVAFGDTVDLPDEAEKLGFVQALVSDGALVKVEEPKPESPKRTARKKTAEA